MRLIIGFFLFTVFTLSVAFSPSVAQIGNTPKISGDWLVDIRTVCVAGGIVLGGAWWLGKYMQKTEDRLQSIEKNAAGRDRMLVDIQRQVRSLSDRRH